MGIEEIFLMLVGVAFVAGSAALTVQVWKRRRTWTRTDATIVSVKEKKKRKHDPGMNPNATETHIKFRFTDTAGQTHIGNNTPLGRKPKRGDVLPIRYNPDEPAFNETATGGDRAVGLVVVAGLFLIGVFFFLWGFTESDGLAALTG